MRSMWICLKYIDLIAEIRKYTKNQDFSRADAQSSKNFSPTSFLSSFWFRRLCLVVWSLSGSSFGFSNLLGFRSNRWWRSGTKSRSPSSCKSSIWEEQTSHKNGFVMVERVLTSCSPTESLHLKCYSKKKVQRENQYWIKNTILNSTMYLS